MLLTQGKQGCAFYIHLRVSRAEFDNCVSCGKAQDPLPDLPFRGYMQATMPLIRLDLPHLKKWRGMIWDPIRGRLSSHDPYKQDILQPSHTTAAAYVYFPVIGVPAGFTSSSPSSFHPGWRARQAGSAASSAFSFCAGRSRFRP
jgi:hypothetical protein